MKTRIRRKNTRATSTQLVELVRAQLLRELPRKHTIVYEGRTYWVVPHQAPMGTRYNLQIDDRWYSELTLSGLAAVIAYDQ